jgi:hypothetical protein
MKGWGKRIEEESLDSLIGRIDIPANRTDIYLDKQDVEILSLVRQGIWQTRKLRKEMNIGQNKLLKKLKKLKLNGILTNKWSLYNVGLTERATLRVSDLTYIGLIDAWSRELPEVFIHYCGRKDQFVIVNLPIGDSTRLMNCLRELQWNVTILPLTSGVYGDWGFPYHLWNVDNQEWDAPHLEIKEWLESLHVHPEKVWVDLPEGSSEHVLARI